MADDASKSLAERMAERAARDEKALEAKRREREELLAQEAERMRGGGTPEDKRPI